MHWNLHATRLLLAHAGSLVNYRIERHAIGFRCLMGAVWKLFLRESFVNISTIFTSAKFDASSEVWQRGNSSRTQLIPSKISTNRVKLARIKNCFYECFSHFTSLMRTSIRVTRYRGKTNAKLHFFRALSSGIIQLICNSNAKRVDGIFLPTYAGLEVLVAELT